MSFDVVVAGSLNLDYCAKVDRLPEPGETRLAADFELRFGGKGANQALAAARHGAPVSLLGSVGAEDDGQRYRERLKREGIDLAGIETADGPTGSALITIDRTGENTIVVAPGANAAFAGKHLERILAKASPDALLVLQFEIPTIVVERALRIAGTLGIRTMLNPSPFQPAFPWSEIAVDYLLVNETEAAQLEAGLGSGDPLLARNLVVTRGAKPTQFFGEEDEFETPAHPVDPVDTVGAGDTFAGTLAACLAAGLPPRDAVRRANVAAALSTRKLGAQESIPTLDEVLAVLA